VRSKGFVRDVGFVVAVIMAVSFHLVLGYLYLASGLAVPIVVVALMLIWWAFLGWRVIHFAGDGSWWVLVPPMVALVTLLVVLSVGGRYLGWTAQVSAAS
jgi:hypothetical protein